jgi:hypothetical protein
MKQIQDYQQKARLDKIKQQLLDYNQQGDETT